MAVELEHGCKDDFIVAASEPTHTRWLGHRKYAERVRRGDLNVGDLREYESVVECFHRRNEVANEVLVGGGHDLIPNGDIVDLGAGVERQDVGSDPVASGREFRDCWDVAVANGNRDADAGVSEGSKNIGVAVEDFDLVDGGPGFEKVGDLGRRRKVIGESAIVNADGIGGGGEEKSGDAEDYKAKRL